MTEPPLVLHHYTCRCHGRPGIDQDRAILPRRHPLLGVPLVWLTDQPTADRDALGFSAAWLRCDRTRVRIDVHPDGAVPWTEWAGDHQVPPYARALIETDASPAHWWVSTTPVPVVRIRTPRKETARA